VLTEGFRIRDLQKVLDGKDMSQDIHRHDFYFLLAMKKGSGNHVIDFQSYQVGDRSLFFMRPGQVHELTLKARGEGFLVEFKPDFFRDKSTRQLLRRASAINHYATDASSFIRIMGLLDVVLQEYESRKPGYTDVIKANLSVCFIELVRNRKSHEDHSHSYEQERLEDFLDLLESHITTHKQVADYAGMLNLSVYQLNAITKSTLAKTCSQLIDEHIILEAKRYLLATTNQVNQTAYHLGYDDVSYFIRFFKKHTGYSPEAFRLKFK
jgi:AraC-like DNA-binding protein